MSYQEQKQLLIDKRDSLLQKYYSLYRERMHFMVESYGLIGEASTKEERSDFALNWICQDEVNDKVTRLAAALQYVEEPQNKQTVTNLKDNIKINSKKK